jgi:CheY-like chemotaxis protein
MKMSAQPLRVLVVEDSNDVMELFCTVLATVGYDVKAVRTYDDALAIVPSYAPQVVFTSILIGHHNGFALCSALRQIPETADALIVAITGFGAAWSGDAHEAGFDHYLVKPVALEKMLETMQDLDGYRGNTVPAHTTFPPIA